MEIKQITYQRTKNLGNYESCRLELVAEVNADDDVDEAIALLQYKVHQMLGYDQDEVGGDINPF